MNWKKIICIVVGHRFYGRYSNNCTCCDTKIQNKIIKGD